MNDEIREQVSRTYAEALSKPGGCCSSSCCAPTQSKAERIGYSADELSTVPQDAAENAFGCGNPLAFSGVQEGQTVVDLGSGAGIDVLIASEKVGPTGHVIGVDMTDEMIERARANIARAGAVNAEIRKGIIEQLPVEDSSVDWVISNCVINLSPEKERVFAEIGRVLRPGGRISISDIVADGLPEWVRANVALYSACVSGAITEEAYLQGLREAGLDDLEVVSRYVYDAEQLRGLIESGEIPLPEGIDDALVNRALESLAGRVQSIKVTGQKRR